MSGRLCIDGRLIGDDTDCYVIAEVGHNHQGNLETAKEMFRAAKECGASAVKLQKRDNRSLFTRAMYDKPYENENSFGDTYGEHREALEFGRSEYVELIAYAREIGITMFATAFDPVSADFLAELDVPAYKVASADLVNTPLLVHVAKIGKPMIISTGGARLDDVRRAHDVIMPVNSQLCIMQCTAGYPPAWEEINLKVLETYRKQFPNVVVGFSSHDSGIALAVVAYTLGGRVIEKHFTLNRAMKGTDHKFSLEPVGLRKMVRDLQRVRVAMGDGKKVVYPSEVAPIEKMGKSIVAARSLPSGHVLTEADLALRCPGGGLPGYRLGSVIGKMTTVPLEEDQVIRMEDLAQSAKRAAA